jgi:hypothetical protein
MPDPKDNAKLTRDTHPPEVEDLPRDTPQVVTGGLDVNGRPGDERGLARDLEQEGRPGKGENQAGFIKDKDTPPGR